MIASVTLHTCRPVEATVLTCTLSTLLHSSKKALCCTHACYVAVKDYMHNFLVCTDMYTHVHNLECFRADP